MHFYLVDFYADDKAHCYLAYCVLFLAITSLSCILHGNFLVNVVFCLGVLRALENQNAELFSLEKTNQACHAGIRILIFALIYLVCFLLRLVFEAWLSISGGAPTLACKMLFYTPLAWTLLDTQVEACFSTTDTFDLRACRRCMDVSSTSLGSMDGICLYVPVYTLHFYWPFDVPLKGHLGILRYTDPFTLRRAARHYGEFRWQRGATALAEAALETFPAPGEKKASGSDRSLRLLYCLGKPLIVGTVIACVVGNISPHARP